MTHNLQMPARLLRQYAAIFFFAPMVQLRLEHHNFGLSAGDKNAIKHSISWGYIIFGLGIGFLLSSITLTLYDWVWLPRVYRGLLIATLISIAVGIWQIHHPFDTIYQGSSTLVTNTMLLAYLPGYNRYCRYTQQDPQHPYRWLKESILWRYLIMICLMIPWLSSIGMLLIALMVIRLVVLAAGYDLIPSATKQWLNRHYIIHVDERWAYLSAGIAGLRSSQSYSMRVQQHRQLYRQQLTHSLSHRHTVDRVSYGILVIGLIRLLRYVQMQQQYSLMAPIARWGYALLVIYAVIRWHTGSRSPIPVIHPIVSKILQLLHHQKK